MSPVSDHRSLPMSSMRSSIASSAFFDRCLEFGSTSRKKFGRFIESIGWNPIIASPVRCIRSFSFGATNPISVRAGGAALGRRELASGLHEVLSDGAKPRLALAAVHVRGPGVAL